MYFGGTFFISKTKSIKSMILFAAGVSGLCRNYLITLYLNWIMPPPIFLEEIGFNLILKLPEANRLRPFEITTGSMFTITSSISPFSANYLFNEEPPVSNNFENPAFFSFKIASFGDFTTSTPVTIFFETIIGITPFIFLNE